MPLSGAVRYGRVMGGQDLADAYPSANSITVDLGLNLVPTVSVVVAWSRSVFDCVDPTCSANASLDLSGVFAGPMIRWSGPRRVAPWIQAGWGRVSMEQNGEDVDSRDLSYSKSGDLFIGAAGLDIALGSYLAVTGAVRYSVAHIQGERETDVWVPGIGYVHMVARLPGPLRDHLSDRDQTLRLGLLSFEVGITINPGGTQREQARSGG